MNALLIAGGIGLAAAVAIAVRWSLGRRPGSPALGAVSHQWVTEQRFSREQDRQR